MGPSVLLYLYWRRLRTHPVQELLAGLGIAIGVALVFAVQVANSSIAGSASDVVRGVAGTANLQIVSRDSRGFDQRLIERVRRLPGVGRAAPALEQRATVVGPRGRRVELLLGSVDPSLAALTGALTSNFAAGALRLTRGVMLPSAVARSLELPDTAAQTVMGPPPRVTLELRGRARWVRVAAVLGPETIGALADARVAIAPLRYLQRISGLPGRVTRILVETPPGREAEVRRDLIALSDGRLTVTSPDAESSLLRQAMAPSDQATAFFALISGLVGLLLAFNAMLLTAPERRRMIAELRILGFRPGQIVGLVAFQALALGILASLAGLLAGSLLSQGFFQQTPDYLAAAFPLGSETIVTVRPLALAFLGGVVATCLAASPPLLDLRRSRAVDAIVGDRGEPGQMVSARARTALLGEAVMLVAITSGLLVLTDSAAIVAVVGLALATLLVVPAVFAAVLFLAELVATRARRLNMLAVALFSLRATTLRSLALAAVGAVAVFGSVAIGGARQDLLTGLDRVVEGYVATADIWIVNPLDDQATKDLRPGDLAERVAGLPGVAAVRAYHGGYLDVAGRRVWLIGRPGGDATMVPEAEVVRGDPRLADARLRAGGWIAISDELAAERGAGPGDAFVLPTPTGRIAYRIAATTTNLGWSPGAIVINAADYRRDWATSAPTALEVDAAPGADVAAVQRSVRAAVAPGAALDVQTAAERAGQANELARQGLARLGQISTLLVIAAALAMALAMSAAIWQRRHALAALRLQGFRPPQLRRVLQIEGALVVGAGCLTGAVTALYGEFLIDGYLETATGFPAPFAPTGLEAAGVLLAVVALALLAIALPGYLASQTPARAGLQD